MKIGIFDSGLGGVTVVNELKKQYPFIDIDFFADTARLPYGDKSDDEIIKYSKEIVEFLISKGADLILIACNTATSIAINILRKEYSIKILGVIESTVLEALKNNPQKIGIIATNATIKSNKYFEKIREINDSVDIISRATPLLVPNIEKGIIDGEEIKSLFKIYLKDMENVDKLILACTHYSTLKPFLKREYSNLNLVDSSIEIINNLKNEIDIKFENKVGQINYYVSGNLETFKSNLKNLFSIESQNIFKV